MRIDGRRRIDEAIGASAGVGGKEWRGRGGGGVRGGLGPPGGQNESRSYEWDSKGSEEREGRPSTRSEKRDRPPPP